MCACLDVYGKEGIFNVAVCVEVMVSPLGSLTAKGVAVGFLFEHWHWPKESVHCILNPRVQ
jgi:hypothetical protein